MERRIVEGEVTNCEKVLISISKFGDEAVGSPLLLSQSAKEHFRLPSVQKSFLKSDLKAVPPEGA